MARIGNKQLWRVLTVVTAFLLTISVAAMAIMTEYATMINGALNITNIRMEETGDGSEDTVRFKSEFSTMEELLAHQTALARELEAEGAVLLRNEGGVLPLAQGASVSLFSRSSVDVAYGGTGSGSVNSAVQISMKDAFEAEGRLCVNPTLWDAYVSYTESLEDASRVLSDLMGGPSTFYVREADASVYTSAVRGSYSSYSDAAIVVLTRSGGEGADLKPGDFADGSVYLRLQEAEKAMLKEVQANFENIIVLVNSSNAMELDWLDEYGVDAALWIGGVGQEGLNAVADILVGKVNPSGRLVDTDFALFSYMEARSGVMAGTTDFAVTSDARASELLKSLDTDAQLYAAVRESAHRNLYVIANSAEMNGFSSTAQITIVLTWYQTAAIAAIAVFGVAAACCVTLLTVQTYAKKKEEM